MRTVFMGTPDFAVPSLEMLIRRGNEIVGVFTQPDRPKGRGNKLTPSPIKTAAVKYDIPVFQPERIRKSGVEDLKALHPDICITAAFGQILSQEILDIPKFGNINVHASLLPRHRGSAPIARAIMDGDSVTGVTTMMMDQGIDTGDMLLQAQTEIGQTETCDELTGRLSLIGAQLLDKTLCLLEEGTLERVPQNEEEMTYDPMLDKTLSNVDFNLPANLVRGRINGLNPWPCVSIPVRDGRLKLLRADNVKGTGRAGEILEADPKAGLIIACGEDAVRVLELQAPGGKRMKAEDYLRGHTLRKGSLISEEQI